MYVDPLYKVVGEVFSVCVDPLHEIVDGVFSVCGSTLQGCR